MYPFQRGFNNYVEYLVLKFETHSSFANANLDPQSYFFSMFLFSQLPYLWVYCLVTSCTLFTCVQRVESWNDKNDACDFHSYFDESSIISGTAGNLQIGHKEKVGSNIFSIGRQYWIENILLHYCYIVTVLLQYILMWYICNGVYFQWGRQCGVESMLL